MPNQSDPNQTNTQPPVIPPQTDLPPLPPDLQSETAINNTPPAAPTLPETSQPTNTFNSPPATTDQPVSENSGTAAPPDLPPVVSSPKKKYGTGRIIATILSVLLLVGGVGAGYLLTQQPQIFQGKAWITQEPDSPETDPGNPSDPGDDDDDDDDDNGPVVPPPANPPSAGTQPQGTYPVYEGGASSGTIVGYRYIQAPGVFEGAISRAASGTAADLALLTSTYGMTQEDINNAAAHIANGETWVPAGVGCTGTVASETEGDPSFCGDWHWTTCEQAGSGVGGIGCGVTTNEGDDVVGDDDVTPTPTPSVTAACLNVKAYDETFSSATPLTPTQLSALSPGDKVNFCVAGTASANVFDKAQFQIGTNVLPETTTKRTGSQDFCQIYTIQTTDTTVSVKAKINHVTQGWVGEVLSGTVSRSD